MPNSRMMLWPSVGSAQMELEVVRNENLRPHYHHPEVER